MRFIGSKERLLPFIETTCQRYVGPSAVRFGDLFCGTAAVSRLFKSLGHKVVANDNLRLGYVFAQAALNISDEPSFEGLRRNNELCGAGLGSLYPTKYDSVLARLNDLPGEDGFMFREYSPGGSSWARHQRQYFSDENARKIDAIRRQIAMWKEAEVLNEFEHCLLLADLMRATNRVANIAGTYGFFMKAWDPRAQKALRLQRSRITPSSSLHDVFWKDANQITRDAEFDALYLDPPYTWRHYGAYYHILETIACGDEPIVSGRSGLRPWEDSKSRYCDRTEAAKALAELIASAKTTHLLLSYNDEGLIQHDEIMDILATRGHPVAMEIGYRRYRSNSGGSDRRVLKERLYYVKIQDRATCQGTGRNPVLAHAAK